jgi:5'-3' exonuclease
MHIHVDADLLVYRCGFAAEKGRYHITFGSVVQTLDYKSEVKAWLESEGLTEDDVVIEFERVPEPVENALHNVKSMMRDIEEAMGTNAVTLYLSGDKNYREEIATIRPYKGNRDENHKPVHGQAIKDYMKKKWEVVVSDREEADDTIGWTHYAMYRDDPLSTCIVTVDKDLDMIPGMHYNFLKDTSKMISENYALRFFYKQLLTGDSTDNIVGVPGIGEKRAEGFLAELDGSDEWAMYKVVKGLYEDAYGAEWRVAMLENAQLLWIRRYEDETYILYEEKDNE